MPSFDVTFLGHQGWLFSAGETHILVDPLLTNSIGHGGAIGEVFPPRIFDFAKLPPIDALVLTHEHEDHFDIPSLSRIDRRVPVILSAHSSRAARAILDEMGFHVLYARPRDVLRVGALEVFFLAADLALDAGDEWDVLPYLVRDRRGHGAFFSSVNVVPNEQLEAAVRGIVEHPPLWTFTDNSGDWSCLLAGRVVPSQPYDSGGLARRVDAQWSEMAFRWGPPIAGLFCGGGMSFKGERAWLNRNVFRTDPERVATAMETLGHGPFLAPLPGETLSMVEGALLGRRPSSPFLRAPAREEWPSRAYEGDVPLMEGYEPFTGKRDLDPGDLEVLERELVTFAEYLCGGKIFRALYSLDPKDLGGRAPTFTLVLLRDGDEGPYVYEYDAAGVRFVPVKGKDPVADYVGGLECWASDFLATLRGDAHVSSVVFGRGRGWSTVPERVRFDFADLFVYSHPLRRPDRALTLYRRLRADHADSPICVRPSTAADVSLLPSAA